MICEPNIYLQENIKKNRSAKLIANPITDKSIKKVSFYMNKDPYQSSLNKSKIGDEKIILNSYSLNDLILNRKTNSDIDYISIDTEGNEYKILKNFDFKKFNIKIFTIEHNFEKTKRKKIYEIMIRNNYKRVFKNISYMDDWYLYIL